MAQGTYKDVCFAFPGGYSKPFDLVYSPTFPGSLERTHQSSPPRVYFDAMGRPWSGEIQALDKEDRRLHFRVRAATNAALKPGVVPPAGAQLLKSRCSTFCRAGETEPQAALLDQGGPGLQVVRQQVIVLGGSSCVRRECIVMALPPPARRANSAEP